MLSAIAKPFQTNEFGHKRLLWSYFVKGDVRRRARYAAWLAKRRPDVGDRDAAYRALTATPAFDIPDAAGLASAAPGVVPGTEAAVADITRLKERTVLDPKKPFLRTLELEAEDLAGAPGLLAYATEPSLVAAIARYMGCLPVLHYVSVWISSSAEGPAMSSQLLHCDADDQRNMSLFLYASDVDEKSGPVTAVPADISDSIRNAVGYTYGGKRYRVLDEEAAPFVQNGGMRRLTGPAGTLAAVDTARCFHQGSRVEPDGAPRVVAIMRYLTPNGFFWPAKAGYRAGVKYAGLVDAATPDLARRVLGAD